MPRFLHGTAGEEFLDLEGLLDEDVLDIVRKIVYLVFLGLGLELCGLLLLGGELEPELLEFCLVPEVVA